MPSAATTRPATTNPPEQLLVRDVPGRGHEKRNHGSVPCDKERLAIGSRQREAHRSGNAVKGEQPGAGLPRRQPHLPSGREREGEDDDAEDCDRDGGRKRRQEAPQITRRDRSLWRRHPSNAGRSIVPPTSPGRITTGTADRPSVSR